MKNLGQILFATLITLGTSLCAYGFNNDVKVLISKCANGAPISAGSGVGFNHNQTQYVVTSEHVVSIRSDICYSAQLDGASNPAKLEVVSTDWSNGLALLKIVSAQPIPLLNLSETFETQGLTDNELVTSAFPQQSSQRVRDRARVVINGSLRGGFVGQVQLLELVGPIAEYGMSGGSVRGAQNDKVIGLISHQRVYLTPGKPSLIASEGEVKGVQSNHFIVISSHSVMSWIQRTLSGRAAEFSRVSSEVVRGMGLFFKQPATADRLMLARGGGDGVGATGEDDVTDRPGISVEVGVANMSELITATQNQLTPESEWIKSLAHEVLRKQKLEFTHLLVMTESGSDVTHVSLRLKSIQSLNQMLAAVRSGRAIPILKTNESREALPELAALKSALEIKSDSSEVENLLSIVKKLIDLKNENPDARLPQKYLNALEQHPGWNSLSDLDFDKAVLAKRFLLGFSASTTGLAR